MLNEVRVNRHLHRYGVPGDGMCLLHALSASLNKDADWYKTLASQLASVCDAVVASNHQNEVNAVFGDGRTFTQQHIEPLRQAESGKFWLSAELVSLAISNYLHLVPCLNDVRIEVFMPAQGNNTGVESQLQHTSSWRVPQFHGEPNATIALVNNNHYDALLSVEEIDQRTLSGAKNVCSSVDVVITVLLQVKQTPCSHGLTGWCSQKQSVESCGCLRTCSVPMVSTVWTCWFLVLL